VTTDAVLEQRLHARILGEPRSEIGRPDTRSTVVEVVVALAGRDPSMETVTDVWCALCVVTLDTLADESTEYVGRVTQHEEDCPWRRARELVHDLEERGR
jgi:hypothetical protein